MLLQAITIADQRYESARDSVDFIKRYIFPGCCIPSCRRHERRRSRARATCASSTSKTSARTTRRRSRTGARTFSRTVDRVRALGYPDAFIRMWEFYLSYCEGGFAERALGDVQMLLAKPRRSAGPLQLPRAITQPRRNEMSKLALPMIAALPVGHSPPAPA